MLLFNVRYQWNIFGDSPPDGVVFHASANCSEDFTRRQVAGEIPSFRLLDPDSYLLNLDSTACGKSCSYLATQPWLPVQIPDYDSGTHSRSQWRNDAVIPALADNWPPSLDVDGDGRKKIISDCLNWQRDFGVSRLIVPTPLIDDPESLDQFLGWLDDGLEVAADYDETTLVTVFLAESVVRQQIEPLADQLTAREELAGIYLGIESSYSSVIPISARESLRALLDLSFLVGHECGCEVVVNYCDAFGLACMAVGAGRFVAGYDRKTRRLCFSDYEDDESGFGAFPRFFSLSTGCMYRAVKDLIKLRDERLLRRLAGDQTATSRPLLDALRSGVDESSVPPFWKESRGNIAKARTHLIERLTAGSQELVALSDLTDRINWAIDWLQDADATVTYLNRRFQDDPLDDVGAHIAAWRAAFEGFLDDHSLA